MKKQLTLLLVDFDGVLSNGRFYQVPNKKRSEIGKAAAGIIFGGENQDLVNQWMRGASTYTEVHDQVERQAGIDARLLDELLKESLKYMLLNPSLLRFVSELRSHNVKVGLFTNNMDVFDDISRSHHKLDEHFDHIYSSSNYGQLKLENDTLLKRALADAGTDTSSVALVDDSPNSFAQATSYGINTFLYDQYEDSQPMFEQWLGNEYEWKSN